MPESLVVTAARRPLVGTVLTLPGATAAELLAEPFDLVWIDLEHGALGRLDAQEMLLGAQATGAYALVRLPADAHREMTTRLDAGADGVVLADVRDAEAARAVLARVVHPPDGTRGWGPRRLGLRQRRTRAEQLRPTVWAQIESLEGVERAGEIATVAGLDALVVGTADLSFALGTPLDVASVEMREAIDAVRRACEAADVALGLAGPLDAVPAEAREGASILVHSTDARLCASAVDAAADWLRTLSTPDSEAIES
jgi:4-hydroxy-2-oxoheptanedioate aldolase